MSSEWAEVFHAHSGLDQRDMELTHSNTSKEYDVSTAKVFVSYKKCIPSSMILYDIIVV